MRLYLIKIEGVMFENPPKLKRAIILSAGGDKLEARDVAIDWFKKHIAGTIVAMEVVADFEVPEEPKALFGIKAEYSPVPTGMTIVLPKKG
jgi:hypothetical protein